MNLAVRMASVCAALLALLVLSGCDSRPAAPSPPPDPNLQVTPGESSGPVGLRFITANIPPGSTVTGCGTFIEGCRGKLRLTLQLSPSLDGPVLYVRLYLHAMRNGVACLWGDTAPFTVRAGQPVNVDVTLDNADRCSLPETFATMYAIVEGPVQFASRQVWGVHYVFCLL